MAQAFLGSRRAEGPPNMGEAEGHDRHAGRMEAGRRGTSPAAHWIVTAAWELVGYGLTVQEESKTQHGR
jgi:hypothetical protein